MDILISPVDRSLVIFQGTHGINWKSDNCGQDVVAMNAGRQVHLFEWHPTERNWLLASAWQDCLEDEYEDCTLNRELYVTKDVGENWEHIAEYVFEFSWAKVRVRM